MNPDTQYVEITLHNGDNHRVACDSPHISHLLFANLPNDALPQDVAHVKLPDGILTLLLYCFAECVNLLSVAFPSTLQHIRLFAFYNCRNLQRVHLPEGLQTLSQGIFSGCTLLHDVRLPRSLYTMSNRIFADCDSLERIIIPPLVNCIPRGAFSGCRNLRSVTLPASVHVDPTAFNKCGSMNTLYIRDAVAGPASRNGDWSKFVPPARARVWAPDAVIAQLGGPFSPYSTLASLPAHLKIVPGTPSWATAELHRDWGNPSVNYIFAHCRLFVWTVMHVAARLDVLPDELWLLILTFTGN